MKKIVTCWATCGLGLGLLMSSGCAATKPSPPPPAAQQEAVREPTNVTINVVQGAQEPAPQVVTDVPSDQEPLPAATAPAPEVEKTMPAVATVPQRPASRPEDVAATGAPSPAEEAVRKPASPSPSPVALARTAPAVYRYQPDASRSLGTENMLSEICKEVAGKVYYELKQNGERNLTSRVAVVAAVPLSDLKRETEFGRLIGEELLTDLADRGLKVIELRLGKEINILPQTGEFILSRNIGELANDMPMLDYVMVSTFTNTRQTLILQGRLVGLKTGLVESSWRYTLPLNRELLGLFHEPEQPFTIAVKGMRR